MFMPLITQALDLVVTAHIVALEATDLLMAIDPHHLIDRRPAVL